MSQLPTKPRIDQLIDRLDGSGSADSWDAARQLHVELGADLPRYLLARYQTNKRWGARSSYLYHSVRYASTSAAAIELALCGVLDRSKAVRYRACMLLACSRRKDLVPALEALAEKVPANTKADLMAAIDAIESENHNYFVDRDHSEKSFLVIH